MHEEEPIKSKIKEYFQFYKATSAQIDYLQKVYVTLSLECLMLWLKCFFGTVVLHAGLGDF